MRRIIEISDLSAPEIDVYARLTETELRHRLEPEKGVFIAEGVTVIGHALNAGCQPLSFLMERKHINGKAGDLIDRADVPVYTADSEALSSLTGFPLTRGVLCAMRRPTPPQAEDICQRAQRIAVLESVADPSNIGAILRSAAALSIDAVLLTPSCADPLCRRAVRVSMGTAFTVPWSYLNNLSDGATDIARLKAMGFHTAAMALSNDAVDIDHPRLAKEARLAIVLGNEGDGLRPQTVAACDDTVRIPMRRGVDSLNVAAASAVAFWQLRVR